VYRTRMHGAGGTQAGWLFNQRPPSRNSWTVRARSHRPAGDL
jgi:hypothetical protein